MRPHPLQSIASTVSFERQLLNVRLGHDVIVVANIYRPSSSSKTELFTEFEELLTSLELQVGDRVLICGDFNMPGQCCIEIDHGFSSLLDRHGMTQHVRHPTRRGATTSSDNILDLVITTDSSSLVKSASDVESHLLSDHRLIVCSLRTGRMKQSPPIRVIRRLKKIDSADFELRLRQSPLFIDPATTVDLFTTKIEEVITNLLAPLHAIR